MGTKSGEIVVVDIKCFVNLARRSSPGGVGAARLVVLALRTFG